MKKILFIFPVLAMALTSCLDDPETVDYKGWWEENNKYVETIAAATQNGKKEYKEVVAPWAPKNPVYIKWHNDTTATSKNLQPLPNSTVTIKYKLENIKGEALDSSFLSTDSAYTSKPLNNILGMQVAMTNMHVGDSVTLVIPSVSGYGAVSSGSVLPFSTLIFHMKMKRVDKYDIN